MTDETIPRRKFLVGAGLAGTAVATGLTQTTPLAIYDLVQSNRMAEANALSLLPDGDGLAVLTAARRIGKALPILILTARDAVEDRVAGLNAGADDYLIKPFAMSELIARINALLRRPGGVLGIKLEAGNVRLDTVGRELTVAGKPVRLSRRELAILEQMMRRFGRIVPKTVLEEKLYGIDEEPDSNPIPVHVHHLRRQLETANANLAIHTIRGVGYILAETKS